ncbi:MAG: transcription antitermination protein NusB [Erysipelothrix sp.]|jgi:N utilization substance protein B|nr:transcription antitermination protein NusB [Erysipelothrix sp.]
MSRSTQRKEAMFYLYQYLLKENAHLKIDSEDVFLLNEAFQSVIGISLTQKKDLVELINDELIDWTFDRLGFIEQAILLLACGEAIILQTEKQVIIDEAVKLAKEFGDEDDTYKLINATLDKVLDI